MKISFLVPSSPIFLHFIFISVVFGLMMRLFFLCLFLWLYVCIRHAKIAENIINDKKTTLMTKDDDIIISVLCMRMYSSSWTLMIFAIRSRSNQSSGLFFCLFYISVMEFTVDILWFLSCNERSERNDKKGWRICSCIVIPLFYVLLEDFAFYWSFSVYIDF